MSQILNSTVFWSCIIRGLIYSSATTAAIILFTEKMMQRRKGLVTLVLLLSMRNVITCFFLVLKQQGIDYSYVHMLSNLFFVVAGFFMFYYVYEVTADKILIIMFVQDVLGSIVSLIPLIIINRIENRGNLMTIVDVFHPLDILLLILTVGLTFFVRKALEPILFRIKNYEIRHKKITTFLLLSYIVAGQISTIISDYKQENVGLYVIYMFPVIMLLSILVLGNVYLQYQNRKQKKELELQEFQEFQQYCIGTWLKKLMEEIAQINENWEEIEEQMKEFEALEKSKSNISEEDLLHRIQSYIDSLKKEYQSIQAGIFHKDQLLDAVIFCETETAKKHQISIDTSLQGVQRGSIPEEILAQIIYKLLSFGINAEAQMKADQPIILHGYTSANQLVLDYETACPGYLKFPKKELQSLLEQYDGWMNIKWDKGKLSGKVLMNTKA